MYLFVYVFVLFTCINLLFISLISSFVLTVPYPLLLLVENWVWRSCMIFHLADMAVKH